MFIIAQSEVFNIGSTMTLCPQYVVYIYPYRVKLKLFSTTWQTSYTIKQTRHTESTKHIPSNRNLELSFLWESMFCNHY